MTMYDIRTGESILDFHDLMVVKEREHLAHIGLLNYILSNLEIHIDKLLLKTGTRHRQIKKITVHKKIELLFKTKYKAMASYINPIRLIRNLISHDPHSRFSFDNNEILLLLNELRTILCRGKNQSSTDMVFEFSEEQVILHATEEITVMFMRIFGDL